MPSELFVTCLNSEMSGTSTAFLAKIHRYCIYFLMGKELCNLYLLDASKSFYMHTYYHHVYAKNSQVFYIIEGCPLKGCQEKIQNLLPSSFRKAA